MKMAMDVMMMDSNTSCHVCVRACRLLSNVQRCRESSRVEINESGKATFRQ
jgi:hypothetical protein